MVKPVVLVLAAVPAIAAMLLVSPLILRTEVPRGAALPDDRLDLEYTRHDLRTVSFGITERLASEKTEYLEISDGQAAYYTIESGVQSPEEAFEVDPADMLSLVAFVKETGVMSLPPDAFPVRDGQSEYTRSTLETTLNGAAGSITWPDQGATDRFVPPVVTELEAKLRAIIERGSE